MIDFLDTAKKLHPCLMHPAADYELVVRQQELYAEDRASEARRALAQSMLWCGGVLFIERRPVGRVKDIKRSRILFRQAVQLAAEELKSELALDENLNVDMFMAALATEYSRILQGPDMRRLRGVMQSDLAGSPEAIVPRMEAITLYGDRLVPDREKEKLQAHTHWLERASEKGII